MRQGTSSAASSSKEVNINESGKERKYPSNLIVLHFRLISDDVQMAYETKYRPCKRGCYIKARTLPNRLESLV